MIATIDAERCNARDYECAESTMSATQASGWRIKVPESGDAA